MTTSYMLVLGVTAVLMVSAVSAYSSRARSSLRMNLAAAPPHQGCFLDLPSAFLANQESHGGDVRMMSLATYLTSLRFDNGPITFWSIVAALIHAKMRGPLKWLALAFWGLVPRKFLASRVHVNSPEDMLHQLAVLNGINSFMYVGALADLWHYWHASAPHPFTRRPYRPKHTRDAVDALCRGGVEHDFADWGERQPFTAALLQQRVDARCAERLPNENPDVLHYATPQPFLPEVFPRLCIGWGGLKPLQTPRTAQRNELMAQILNRLSANVYILSGIQQGSLFTIEHQGRKLVTPHQFISAVPGLHVCFSRNSSSFGFMLCAKDVTAPETLDPLDEASREAYTQIPLVWAARTAMRHPDTGAHLTSLSYHASLVVEGQASKCPFGEFRVQFFLGPDGCTSWKAGNDYHRPWARFIQTPVPVEGGEAALAVGLAGAVACASNLAARHLGVAKGGYAQFGTCCDSVALVEHALRGQVDVFPVVMTGDSSATMAQMCSAALLPALRKRCQPEDIDNNNNKEEEDRSMYETLVDHFERVKASALAMPNDNSPAASTMPSTLRRMAASTIGEFECTAHIRNDVAQTLQSFEALAGSNLFYDKKNAKP